MDTNHELLDSLSEKEQQRLARTPEARLRAIDIHGSCREGPVVAVRDPRRRVAGFMARRPFDKFSFLHSAIFTRDVADILYEHAFRAAVQNSVGMFLALKANRFACRMGMRYGAFAVGLDMVDEVIPEFVDCIRDFPPGDYYRQGNSLRSIHDTPEQHTIVFMVTRLSFQRAERRRMAVRRRQSLGAPVQQLRLAL